MSWSVKVAGKPTEVLEKFVGQVKSSWGYKNSIYDKEALDWVIASVENRLNWYTSNGTAPVFELESTGHFDDTTGTGNVSVNVRVLGERRRA